MHDPQNYRMQSKSIINLFDSRIKPLNDYYVVAEKLHLHGPLFKKSVFEVDSFKANTSPRKTLYFKANPFTRQKGKRIGKCKITDCEMARWPYLRGRHLSQADNSETVTSQR